MMGLVGVRTQTGKIKIQSDRFRRQQKICWMNGPAKTNCIHFWMVRQKERGGIAFGTLLLLLPSLLHSLSSSTPFFAANSVGGVFDYSVVGWRAHHFFLLHPIFHIYQYINRRFRVVQRQFFSHYSQKDIKSVVIVWPS